MAKTTNILKERRDQPPSSHNELPGSRLRWWSNTWELYLHKHTDNCSRKWQKANAGEAPLLLVVCKATLLKTARLFGNQRPNVSTTKGITIPPAAWTAVSWRLSLSASPRPAATPAVQQINKVRNPTKGDAQKHQSRLTYQTESPNERHPQDDPSQHHNTAPSYSHYGLGPKHAKAGHREHHAGKSSRGHHHTQGCGHHGH